jgi:ankyrin repeat protein
VDAVNDNGVTSLHYAATNNHVNVLKELLGHSKEVDIRNAKGFTPLHLAAIFM